MINRLFCDTTRRHLLIGFYGFEGMYCLRFQGFRGFLGNLNFGDKVTMLIQNFGNGLPIDRESYSGRTEEHVVD
jgi:hypothetical protein